jgi:ribose 5-phosphate isomerase B
MGNRPGRVIIGEELIRQLPADSDHMIPVGALVTPLARQIATEKNIQLIEDLRLSGEGSIANQRSISSGNKPYSTPGKKVIALGADHGGFEMKEMLKTHVANADYAIIDCGTNSKESVDYPDFAYAVAQLVADGRAWRGIIIDGAGIGSCMAANKVPGIRAAMCYDQATAVNSRQHNNANVLTLGAGLIGSDLAKQITQTWLKTEFGGGRHARRVDKIEAIGRRYKNK